ncbi:uncharacterized protein DNG_03404 [Cephalotrichum gorgonifer]|uniref:GDP/GTP exchange factor Sec2 N-terminal domain-containing protein n=1 Tax=Cephalotrichum gorgonifer TaxID=2041049 RepID=A0AAE8STJ9_9PEZI|nr:uncharacterized protein DNG_03404 [Cephalotrichum gorgonifer]
MSPAMNLHVASPSSSLHAPHSDSDTDSDSYFDSDSDPPPRAMNTPPTSSYPDRGLDGDPPAQSPPAKTRTDTGTGTGTDNTVSTGAPDPPTTPNLADNTTQTTQTARSPAEVELAEAHSRIVDLEAQLQRLNEKATAAIYRCAAYEDELCALRASQSPPLPASATANTSPLRSPVTPRSPAPPPPLLKSPVRTSFLSSPRFSALLPRRSSPNLRVSVPVDSVEELVLALTKEQALRVDAEERARRTGEEAEELSIEVFERANEMVAVERREKALLGEKIRVLEGRDRARGRRLAVLEGCVGRMETVRALLDEERRRGKEREREKKKQRGLWAGPAEWPLAADANANASEGRGTGDGAGDDPFGGEPVGDGNSGGGMRRAERPPSPSPAPRLLSSEETNRMQKEPPPR